jgi:hypothetical protein
MPVNGFSAKKLPKLSGKGNFDALERMALLWKPEESDDLSLLAETAVA